jgi:hypothetical protein
MRPALAGDAGSSPRDDTTNRLALIAEVVTFSQAPQVLVHDPRRRFEAIAAINAIATAIAIRTHCLTIGMIHLRPADESLLPRYY